MCMYVPRREQLIFSAANSTRLAESKLFHHSSRRPPLHVLHNLSLSFIILFAPSLVFRCISLGRLHECSKSTSLENIDDCCFLAFACTSAVELAIRAKCRACIYRGSKIFVLLFFSTTNCVYYFNDELDAHISGLLALLQPHVGFNCAGSCLTIVCMSVTFMYNADC